VRNAFLAAMLSIVGVTAAATATAPPIVLMVVLDGARADGSGCLDVGPYVAPMVQRLCQGGDGGVAFARAYAQSSSGTASFTTVMTGLLPSAHGMNSGGDPMPGDRPTIASTLAAAGYVTAAFTSESDVIENGQLRGFDESFVLSTTAEQVPGYRFDPAERAALSMLGWIDDHRRDLATKGAFLLLQMAPGRFGYFPPTEYMRRFAPVDEIEHIQLVERKANEFVFQFDPQSVTKLVTATDAGIALADGALALVLEKLRAPDLARRLWVVLLSTYGEARMEHGLVGHGITLYEESIHVPLVIVPPLGRKGGTRLDQVVQLADVMPTILDVAGTAGPPNLPGRSLLPALEGGRLAEREAVSELVSPNPLRVHARTVIDPALMKTFERQDGTGERYDLRNDSGERKNLGRR
jgi:arylsulfatase A-like enzyme